MELIKITEQNGKQAVSARELHSFLEIETRFDIWIKRMFEYGFEEFKDYETCTFLNTHNQQVIDYALSLDCAKEISMIQRSEKGKIARQYFLDCERKLKNPVANLTKSDLARMVIESEEEKQKLIEENNQLKPKAIIADALNVSTTSVLVRDVAYQLKKNGFNIGQDRLFDVLRRHNLIHKNGTKPTQRALELDIFEVQERMVPKGSTLETVFTTKVKGKGQTYILNKFISGQWKST